MNIKMSCARNTRHTIVLVIGAIVVAVVATLGLRYAGSGARLRTRQAEVAARGAQVMPFDLDQTTHIFQPLEDGGL